MIDKHKCFFHQPLRSIFFLPTHFIQGILSKFTKLNISDLCFKKCGIFLKMDKLRIRSLILRESLAEFAGTFIFMVSFIKITGVIKGYGWVGIQALFPL